MDRNKRRIQTEPYSRIIGYNFGTDENGNDRIYNGKYQDAKTGKTRYVFLNYGNSGNVVSMSILDYKGFRAIIDQYDWPKK